MSDSTTSVEPAKPLAAKPPPQRQPRWHVVLIDDDDHTYEYVIRLAQELFGYSKERGYQIAQEVDTEGRVILITTTQEHAELKRDQVIGFGADEMLARSKGAMTCVMEPAPE